MRPPAILMLHGLSSNARYWQRTAVYVPGRRIVALDQRGHGLTGSARHRPASSGGYAMAELVGDAVFAIVELGLGAPVVVGHSWGAAVALELAAMRDAPVSGLVFVDGPVQGVANVLTWDDVQSIMQPPLPRYASIAEAIADSERDFASAWQDDLAPFVEARVMPDGDGLVLTLTAPIRVELLRGLYDSRPEQLWPHVRVPAAVLVASHQPARIAESRDAGIARLRNVAPSVEVKRFATPHDIPLYAPREVGQEAERIARSAAVRSTI